MRPRLVRVAHAYGNRRERIARAVRAGVDLIESDLRWWHGEIYVRHEHRLPVAPLLYNYRLRGIHRQGPYAASLGPLFLRLDVRPIRFAELISRVSGGGGLMLDMKEDVYGERAANAFVDAVVRGVEESRFEGALDFCGSWRLLDLVRARRAGWTVHYSVDSDADWRLLGSRLEGDRAPRGVTIHRELIDASRASVLAGGGVEFFVWDVRDAGDARRAIDLGAAGIIADDLESLGSHGCE